MVAEDDILHRRLARTRGLKEHPEMRTQVVGVVALDAGGFECGLMAGFRIVLFVPLLKVRVLQAARNSITIIARRKIDARLRNFRDTEFGQCQDALRAHKARDFRHLGPECEANVDRNIAVLEQDRIHIRCVAAILRAVDPAQGSRALWRFVDTENELHPAQVNHQVAGDTGSVFFPATPAGEQVGIARPLGCRAEPSVPVEIFWG